LNTNFQAGYSLMEEERPLVGEEAVRAFANALAQNNINLPILNPIIAHNKQVIETMENLWCRAEGKLDTLKQNPFSQTYLAQFYFKQLGNISSKKELEMALQEGRINLNLDINDLISPASREKILRDNPDQIKVLGVDRPVRYAYDAWKINFWQQ